MGVPATISIQRVDLLAGFAFGTTEKKSFPAKYPNAQPPKGEGGYPVNPKDIEFLDIKKRIEDRDKGHHQCKCHGRISPTPPVEHPQRVPASVAHWPLNVL